MAGKPLDAPFTARERACGGLVAAALWTLSIALLVTLVVWSTGPR
jgi:hypothetical protein